MKIQAAVQPGSREEEEEDGRGREVNGRERAN